MIFEKQKALILSSDKDQVWEKLSDVFMTLDIETTVISSFHELNKKLIQGKYDLLVLFLKEKELQTLKDYSKLIEKEALFVICIGPPTSIKLKAVDFYFLRDELNNVVLLPLMKGIFSINQKIKNQSELSGMLIHDIRSPMQSILSYIELIESCVFGPLNEGQKKMVKNALRLQDRILDMIDDLGEVMRFENKSLQLEKTEFKVKPLIQEVIKALWIQADKKNIKFSISLTDENHSIFADRVALGRVISNILTNAVRYSPTNGTVRIECSCGTILENKSVCQFKITDSGPGIDEKDIDYIFNKYYRAYRFNSAKGFGLGLYVARLFVEEHGGTIGVYNNREGGATFHFQIPLKN